VRFAAHAFAAFVMSAVSCGGDGSATTLRLTLRYETAWGLGTVEVKAHETSERSPIAHELQVLMPDEWAGSAVMVELWGLRAEDRYAYGSVTVTPVRRGEVRAEVALTRLPCGAWCTTGATQCEGEAVVACEQRNDDSCLEWSVPIACPVDAPYCSFGVCAATCTDECAEGEARCDGPGAARRCGRVGDRPCFQWLPAVACSAGESCANGRCAAGCTDECPTAATKCLSGGVVVCDDFNHDGCREWGPTTLCVDGQSCTNGVCVEGCVNECSGPWCEDLLFRQCGHYDLSGCLKLSAGTSCVPADGCRAGWCTVTGCAVAEMECITPPAAECTNDHTLRTYEASGACEAGECRYALHERECPDCPSCNPCAGVTCTSPLPAECLGDGVTLRTYGSIGACNGATGACEYPPSDTTCPVRCRGGSCTGNTCGPGWCPLPVLSWTPPPRSAHTAVWTGTEMIIWGGADASHTQMQDGVRFDPRTNVWAVVPTVGAPSARSDHGAVWTGTEMIVWGGYYYDLSPQRLQDGGRFNPVTNTWSPFSGEGAPSARSSHSAVWTGTEMIIWGGYHDGYLQDGARFNPETNGWIVLPTAGAPSARDSHTAVWSGAEMIVWGGYLQGYGYLQNGGRFDPSTNTWSALTIVGAPSARQEHGAVWTGMEMIVWGGHSYDGSYHHFLGDGGRFVPNSSTWASLAATGAPSARKGHSVVWTGSEMLVFGGYYHDGSAGSYLQDGGRWMP
jgi:hypothetical protein